VVSGHLRKISTPLPAGRIMADGWGPPPINLGNQMESKWRIIRSRTLVKDRSDQLVLVRQYRHAAGECFLELPGGAVDPHDINLENAARREFEEETGFTAQRWELITSLHPNPATHTNRVHFFLALDAVCGRPRKLDVGEDSLRVELVEIPFVLGSLRSGLLGQATHISGLLLGLAAAGRLSLTAS
jgi:8-oxo-dGTP pyrophosphatase MutT (NUDIX family)